MCTPSRSSQEVVTALLLSLGHIYLEEAVAVSYEKKQPLFNSRSPLQAAVSSRQESASVSKRLK